MPRAKNKLNQSLSSVIEENILLEAPDCLPDASGLVKCTDVPKMRKIVFINERDNGYPLEFHYHSKTHPLKHYFLYHGEEHDLPEEVIEHLEDCAETLYGHRKNSQGVPETYAKGKKYLFRCKNARRAA